MDRDHSSLSGHHARRVSCVAHLSVSGAVNCLSMFVFFKRELQIGWSAVIRHLVICPSRLSCRHRRLRTNIPQTAIGMLRQAATSVPTAGDVQRAAGTAVEMTPTHSQFDATLNGSLPSVVSSRLESFRGQTDQSVVAPPWQSSGPGRLRWGEIVQSRLASSPVVMNGLDPSCPPLRWNGRQARGKRQGELEQNTRGIPSQSHIACDGDEIVHRRQA